MIEVAIRRAVPHKPRPRDPSTPLRAEGALSPSPLPGDRIIFQRADGDYDVREVSASGEYKRVVEAVSFEAACDVARRQLEAAHRLWACDHLKPDKFELFSRHSAASSRAKAWWSH